MDEDFDKYWDDMINGDERSYCDDDPIVCSTYPAHGVKKRVRAFIGSGPYSYVPLEAPRYYGDLLAWAFARNIVAAGWNMIAVLDPGGVVPTYRSVSVGPGMWAEKLVDGIALLGRDNWRMVATISTNHDKSMSLVLASPANNVENIGRRFVSGVQRLMLEENPYKGGNIQLDSQIRFLDLPEREWDELVLTPGVREEVMANSVDFLRRAGRLASCGISPCRKILLAGHPGAGKTLLCELLMSTCPDLTCIKVSGGTLTIECELHEVYQIARDMSPSIVFLEDVDLIGMQSCGALYSLHEALARLMYMLHGIEECPNVVTVATTNCLNILDEALKDRPPRFHRIVWIERPDLEQRVKFLEHLSRRIPMPLSITQHIAARSDGMTPAQIQEVVHAVVIESDIDPTDCPDWGSVFSPAVVDRALARSRCRNGRVGFVEGSEVSVGHT